MSILDDLLRGGTPLPQGPTSPYGPGIMPRHLAIPQYPSASSFPRPTSTSLFPRHLSIPNVGGSVPLTGTPVNFPTYTPNPLPQTSRLGSIGSSARASFGSSPLARIGKFAKGAGRFGRIGPAAAVGLLASPVGSAVGGGGQDTPGFDRRDVGQFTAGALTGGSLGSLGGWPGAVAGGLIGGVGNALGLFGGGGDEQATTPEDASKALNDAMLDLGLNSKTRAAIRDTTMAQLELATTDAERNAVLQNASALMQQEALAQDDAQQQLAHSLALQAQAARIFEPYAEANQRNADMARVLFESASQDLPPAQRYLAAQFALGAQQQSDALSQQLLTNATAQPRIDALVAQQQQIDSVAAQIVQQATAQAATGQMGGGGGIDIDALLAGV